MGILQPPHLLLLLFFIPSIFSCRAIPAPKEKSNPNSKPNVILILADDYGHANLGYNHAPLTPSSTPFEIQSSLEAHTPTLDGLMKTGIPLHNHYSYKICSPSRSALQSGRLPTHVNYLNTGVLVHNPHDPVSGYQGIPRNMTGLGEKMKSGGYDTHMVGKWDAGMATPDHTPRGRGYDSFYGYFQHANNYWDKKGGIKSTGDVDICLNRFTDLFKENSTYRGGVIESGDLDASCAGSNDDDPACYEEHLFKREGLNIIRNHGQNQNQNQNKNSSNPLFYFHSFHLLHSPLNIPNSYVNRMNEIIFPYKFDSESRQNYSAMALYMDDVVGELVEELKAQGMWDNTVLAFVADNGGPVYLPGSANNFPLKGGKYSDWQGGVKTNAFLAGGWVDRKRESKAGVGYDGVVSIADWYGVFSGLAGVDLKDEKSEKANRWMDIHKPLLPKLAPVDSLDETSVDGHGLLSAILSGSPTNPRPNLPISDVAFLQYPYKLVQGVQPYSDHQGPLYPNCTTIANEVWHNDSHIFDDVIPWSHNASELAEHVWAHDCGYEPGCVFDVEEDPGERNDLRNVAGYEGKGEELKKLLEEANKSLFKPNRGGSSVEACEWSLEENGGYLGPWLDVEGYYTGPFRKFSDVQEVLEEPFGELLEIISGRVVKGVVERVTKEIYPKVFRPPLVKSFDMCLEDGAPGIIG